MKRPHLALLVVAHMLLGVVYSLATPIFEASDEIWHYPVVREIAANRRLPVQDPAASTPWAQEGSQPPLYYVMGAALTGWIDTQDYEAQATLNPFPKIGIPGAADNRNLVAHPPGQSPWQGGTALAVYIIRWFSLLLSAVTVYFSYRLSMAVFPAQPAVAFLTAALVAFNPMAFFINASVNNDNLVMLLSTLGLWLLARDLRSNQPGWRPASTLAIGLVVGLAAITKVSGAVLAPLAVMGFALSARGQGRFWQHWWLRSLACGLAAALAAGWWYVRNWLLYGELLGLRRMAEIAGRRPPGFGLADLPAEWTGFWYSFWGLFGGFNVLAPGWFYAVMGALSLLGAAGLAAGLARGLRRPSARWAPHALLLLYLALTLAGIIRWTLLTPASQGRLLFGGIAPISMYLAWGLLHWLRQRWQQRAAAGLAAGLALIAAYLALFTIAPAYRPPAPIPALPASARPLEARFGEHIHLLGYALASHSRQPGERLDVTLYWQTAADLTQDYHLSLNGFGYAGQHVAKLDTWPGGGLLPTSHWQAGAIYPDRYLIPIDPAAETPTVMRLAVSFGANLLDMAGNEALVAFAGGDPAEAVFLQAGALARPLTSPPPRPAAIASLQHGIELLDYEVLRQDDSLEVRFEWGASAPISGDYTVFVHLYDAAGQLVAQGDAPPRQGYWPTSYWRPGEIVASTHPMAFPQGAVAGPLMLRAGMYDLATLARLRAFDAAGAPWPDDQIVLPVP